VARNNGFEFAKGEYIWFIDSDDWIKENSLNSKLEFCSFNNLDILRIGSIKLMKEVFLSIQKKIFYYKNLFDKKRERNFLKMILFLVLPSIFLKDLI
jgi:glycosyltransferase involved in cell wall biosynthesis